MSDKALAGYRILIIEDDVHIAHPIQRALTGAGAECLWAGDAVGGLSEFKVCDPHLVILSLTVPGMHGYDVCRVIREVSRVPVILMTPNDAREAQVQGFKCGADDCVIKPLDLLLLVARVEAHIRRVYFYDLPAGAAELQEAPEPLDSNSQLPAGWVGCAACDYSGPRAKFEKLTAQGTPYLVCPYCGENKRITQG